MTSVVEVECNLS